MKHEIIQFEEHDILKEIWKPIPGYENDYEASNLGRIRTSINKITYTEKHGIRHWKQRILKYKSNNENAYKTGFRVDLWKNGKPKTYLVARLVASTFISNELSNKKLTVNHINGNRLDNRIENLEWLTLGDNIREGFKTGLYSSSKKIRVFIKQTNEEKEFMSLSQAGVHFKKNANYFANQIRKNKFENKFYKWEIIDSSRK